MQYNDTIKSLIQQFISERDSGRLNSFDEFNTQASQQNREWLKSNILNLEKLTSYSDTEFAQKFFTMYDYLDGSKRSHDRVRSNHKYFQTIEQRVAIRPKFQNIINFILNPNSDHSLILNELMTNPSYKIPGLGKSTIAQLIFAQYTDTPFVNDRTTRFFRSINCPLSTRLDIMQKEINNFFRLILLDFGDKMTPDDIDHLFWYTQEVESGQNFMTTHYPNTYTSSKSKSTSRRKKLTKQEEFDALVAHLQAIHDTTKK